MSVERTSTNDIVVYLSPLQPVPNKVPFELADYVHPGDWATRLPILVRTFSRYSKPTIERIWFLVMIVSALVVPLVLQRIIWNKIVNANNPTSGEVIGAHFINMSLFLGVLFVFLVPMFAWKFIGYRHLKSHISKWSRMDRTTRGMNASVPTWKVSVPKILKLGLTVTISIPEGRQRPSSFHKDAYLPSYINRPNDEDAAYFYSSTNEKAGLPPAGSIGNIPLYLDEKNFNRV